VGGTGCRIAGGNGSVRIMKKYVHLKICTGNSVYGKRRAARLPRNLISKFSEL
jgi:hypothetical protein